MRKLIIEHTVFQFDLMDAALYREIFNRLFFNQFTPIYITQNNKYYGAITYSRLKEMHYNVLTAIDKEFPHIRVSTSHSESEIEDDAEEFIQRKSVSHILLVDEENRIVGQVFNNAFSYEKPDHITRQRFLQLYDNDLFSVYLEKYNSESTVIIGRNADILSNLITKASVREFTMGSDAEKFILDSQRFSYIIDTDSFEIRSKVFSDISYVHPELGSVRMITLNQICKLFELYLLKDFVGKGGHLFFYRLPHEQSRDDVRYAPDYYTTLYRKAIHCDNSPRETEFFFTDPLMREQCEKWFGNTLQYWLEDYKILLAAHQLNGLYFPLDYSSNQYTVDNGFRKTCNCPKSNLTVSVLGACTVFGLLSTDEETIPSLIQSKLHSVGSPYTVKNYGMLGFSVIEEIRRFNRSTFSNNDIVILFLKDYREKHEELSEYELIQQEFPSYPIQSLIGGNTMLEDYFGTIAHCGSKSHHYYAEQIFGDIVPYLNSQIRTVIFHHFNYDEYSENKKFLEYLDKLDQYPSDGSNGAIMMNCNPFTKGHKYLIRYAASRVDNLFIIAVQQENGMFSFHERFEMIQAGCKELANVYVIPAGDYLAVTFGYPAYFDRDAFQGEDDVLNPLVDINLFGKYLAPRLGIKFRFVGTEEEDTITNYYNIQMKKVLPKYGVELIEIPRITSSGKPISAKKVRACIKQNDVQTLSEFLPVEIIEYLYAHKYIDHMGDIL